MADPMCKCGTSMEPQIIEKDNKQVYYWVCPKCGLRREFGKAKRKTK